MTLGELVKFLEQHDLPDDAVICMEAESHDTINGVDVVIAGGVTASIGFGEESRVVFRLP